MRRLFLVLALLLGLSLPAVAQQGNTETILFPGAPSGSCSFIMRAINNANGNDYNCFNGAWNLVGTSGGGLTGSGTANTISKWTAATALGNSSVTDDGTNPTREPNGNNTATGGNFQEYTVDTSGVTLGLLACVTANIDGAGRSKIQTCPLNSVAGLVGVAKSTVAAGGTALVCWTLNCSIITDNQSTATHTAIVSTTTAGQIHDTGGTTSTAGTQNFTITTANAGAGTASIADETSLLAVNPTGGGGGKGTALQANGTPTKGTANLNATTPAALSGDTNVTVQSSNSGNTTSLSFDVKNGGLLTSAPAGTELSGPTPAGASAAAIVQFARCGRVGSASTTFACAFNNPVVSGDVLFAFVSGCSQSNCAGSFPTFTDTLTSVFTNHFSSAFGNFPWGQATAASSGADTITVTFANGNGTNATVVYVVETSSNVGTLDGSSFGIASSFSLTTAAANDLIVLMLENGVNEGSNNSTITVLTCPSCTIYDTTTIAEPSLLAFGSTGTAGTYTASASWGSAFGNGGVFLAFTVSAATITGTPSYKNAALNLPPNPFFSSIGAGSAALGLTDFNSATVITSAPPAGSGSTGWKATLFTNIFAFGVANGTFAFSSNAFLSLFSNATPPANNGTLSTPDTNAKASLGIDGSFRGTSTILTGNSSAATYSTATNCSSSASPAACGSAAAGSFVIAAGATTVTVNTTAVTANSQIFVEEDQSLGTKLGVTCNTGISSLPAVSARTAATSFSVVISASLATNPVCYSFWIVN